MPSEITKLPRNVTAYDECLRACDFFVHHRGDKMIVYSLRRPPAYTDYAVVNQYTNHGPVLE